MKSFYVIVLILKQIWSIPTKHKDFEHMYVLKCLSYLFISSIYSIFIGVTVPLGAIIMLFIFVVDKHNKRVKFSMILTGVMVVFLSSTNFSTFITPIYSLYLENSIDNLTRIEVHSYSTTYEQFLFDVYEPQELQKWYDILENSEPIPTWNYKTVPKSNGYKLTIHTLDGIQTIILSNTILNNKNLFFGDYYIPFYNSQLLDMIHKEHPVNPEVLTINVSTESIINISNATILDTLWEIIIWSDKEDIDNFVQDNFTIPAYLFFDTNLGCRLFFSYDFKQAYIEDQGVISLPTQFHSMMYEQFTLSQQSIVNKFRQFTPIHTSAQVNNNTNFYIEPNENGLFFGLYRADYINQDKIFLHSVESLESQVFVLKSPYLILLDQKSASLSDLLLINQNIPESHRYVVKNQNILSHSVAICPQNTNFIYIENNQDISTLFYVNNYYQSPKPIASGAIKDCVFLSDNLVAFTQKLQGDNLLCVYDTQINKIVKYTHIPGELYFIDSYNNQILFAIQNIENLDLKEGIFILNSDLSIISADFNKTSLY
ncbi:MAG: hypothetical protein BEN19_04265 [Epulopiscium sp. Nuni2H_MBin003]|nr:MAG: hypothetical protein BEN19_04265 [Epulopiscium sp. Nuni2H_MBin003]